MESGEESPSGNAAPGEPERATKRLSGPSIADLFANERSASPVSTSYSTESVVSRPSRPSTARQEEVRWSGPRTPHFRAVSELGFFASSVRRQIRTAVPTSRLRVTTSAPSPEMEASMARVASPVSSFYVEGEYTAHLHVTTEEEELTRAVSEKRVEYSRLHVVLLEKMQQMADVGHVYRKMCLEQDWEEFERLQVERREKQEELDGIFRDQDEAWRYAITLKMLLKRMVDLKREMMAMVALMRDSRVKTEGQIVETNVKLAEANRSKTVSLEELDDLKAKLREQREYRKKELEFLRSGIDDIKESRMREVKRQEKHHEILARMKNEEHQRRMERLRRAKAAEEGYAAAAEAKMAKQEAPDELALAERILEATGVSDPNLFLVKMLTREQTHDSLELQKARAHDAFERLNQSLQTLILHKRELQLEGVDEAYQKRSTGDIESRLIKCEGRLARALRLYHQSVELITPIRSGLDALCSRIFPNSKELERRGSATVNSSMLMGTWAETPKPVSDESRQLEDTLSKMDTIGDKLVKLMESVDPGSVALTESSSRRRSARQSATHTPRGFLNLSRSPSRSRIDTPNFVDSAFRRKSSDETKDKARAHRRSDEPTDSRDRPPVQRRSSEQQEPDSRERPLVPQRRSSDFRDDRARPGEKGHRRRASDFSESHVAGDEAPKRRSADSLREAGHSAGVQKEPGRRSEGEYERFESLISPSDSRLEGVGVTETILEELVSEVESEFSDGGRSPEAGAQGSMERVKRSPTKRKIEESMANEDLKNEKLPVEGNANFVESASWHSSKSKAAVAEPQVTIKEPPADPGTSQAPGKDAPGDNPTPEAKASGSESALAMGVKRAIRRTMLQQSRASGIGVSIDESRTKKSILPGTRLRLPTAVEKVYMPKYNFRVAPLDGAVTDGQANRRSGVNGRRSGNGAVMEEEVELDMAREHAEFKQELERLSGELSGDFSDGDRPRSRLRERLNMLLLDDEEDLGFKRDFASVDLVALREKFSKSSDVRKGKSNKHFLKRLMNKQRSPERRKRGMENKMLGQLEIPGLNMGGVLNGAVSPPPAVHRKPLYEKKSELKGYSVISEKEQKRMLELLEDIRSKPKIRKAHAERPKSPVRRKV